MKALILTFTTSVILLTSWTLKDNNRVIDEEIRLGATPPIHYIKNLDSKKISQGESLIKKGFAELEDGKKSKLISKHFVCTSCHNLKKEDADLLNPTPESRLDYASKNIIPFLQGTTLYGTVNRKHWYNGDYAIKYGSLVTNAKDTLENAIQLCAQECSQGRILEKWEVESILHYLWTIDLKTSDLKSHSYKNLKELKQQYKNYSPATFKQESMSELDNIPYKGNIEKGELIYDLSCLFCHSGPNQASNLKLKKDKYTLRKFKRNLNKGTNFDIIKIVRQGTKPHQTHKPYMPHYTQERLSSNQLKDLIAYINSY